MISSRTVGFWRFAPANCSSRDELYGERKLLSILRRAGGLIDAVRGAEIL
jgi:hypothetical protein